MNNHQKKLLAEKLGYKIDYTQPDTYAFWIVTPDKAFPCDDWEPDENYNQFREIWQKLTTTQKLKVVDRLRGLGQQWVVISIILFDLPGTMQAVMEVIDE